MAKPSRWNAEKRYQIVKEALSQKEPMGQIARRHQVARSKLADAIRLNNFDR